jgi:hypothetical protein
MVLIWQTLVVTSCRHAHHNGACLSAWHTYNAVTPSLPTGSLYNTNQSRQSSWLHKRQHTLQFQLNYRFSNSVTYLPQTYTDYTATKLTTFAVMGKVRIHIFSDYFLNILFFPKVCFLD